MKAYNWSLFLLTFDGYFATRLLEVLERAIISCGLETITIEVVKITTTIVIVINVYSKQVCSFT